MRFERKKLSSRLDRLREPIGQVDLLWYLRQATNEDAEDRTIDVPDSTER